MCALAQLPNLLTMEFILMNNFMQLHTSQIHTDLGYVHIHANDEGIVSIAFAEDALEPDENPLTKLAAVQLSEYFAQKRKHFQLPLAAKGTNFQQGVWAALCNIEYGQTASYLDIATNVCNPKACRAVGAANGKNPIAIVVPCHRIIGSNGTLTGYAGGMNRKSYLLALENN